MYIYIYICLALSENRIPLKAMVCQIIKKIPIKMQYIAILRYNEVWWGIMRSHNCVLQYIEVYWPNFQTPICLICLDHTHFGESTETAVALSTKVVVGDAKTALVAVRPLKVVNEGPGSITCQAGNVWVIIYKFANI